MSNMSSSTYSVLKYATDEEKASIQNDVDIYQQNWEEFASTNEMTKELEKSNFAISKKMQCATMNTVKEIHPDLYQKLVNAFMMASQELGNCDKDVTPQLEEIFSIPMWKPAFAPDQYMLDFFSLLKKNKMIVNKPKASQIHHWMNQHKEIFLELKQLIKQSYGISTSM